MQEEGNSVFFSSSCSHFGSIFVAILFTQSLCKCVMLEHMVTCGIMIVSVGGLFRQKGVFHVHRLNKMARVHVVASAQPGI